MFIFISLNQFSHPNIEFWYILISIGHFYAVPQTSWILSVTEFIIITVVLNESSHMGLLEIYWGHIWLSQVILRLGTISIKFFEHFPGGRVVKNPSANAGDARDVGLILGSGRSPRNGHSDPLQYSCLENPMDRGSWQAAVHKVTKSWTRLSMHA